MSQYFTWGTDNESIIHLRCASLILEKNPWNTKHTFETVDSNHLLTLLSSVDNNQFTMLSLVDSNYKFTLLSSVDSNQHTMLSSVKSNQCTQMLSLVNW